MNEKVKKGRNRWRLNLKVRKELGSVENVEGWEGKGGLEK